MSLMKLWKNALGAEVVKLKNNSFFWLHILIPLGGATIVALYYQLSHMSIENKFSMYISMVAVAFPFMISIVTAISFKLEEQNGFYQLLSAVNRKVVVLSKLTILFAMGCFSSALALSLFPIFVGR